MFSPLLNQLANAFSVIPGIGHKTALRIACYLMNNDVNKEKAQFLHHSLQVCLHQLQKCRMCQMINDHEVCTICQDTQRQDQLCVVDNIYDLMNIENLQVYRGRYFILYGCISPIEGIGPQELNFPILEGILRKKACPELILALPISHMGLVTQKMIVELAQPYVAQITTLRCGIPFGSDIEHLDQNTLIYAFKERTHIGDTPHA